MGKPFMAHIDFERPHHLICPGSGTGGGLHNKYFTACRSRSNSFNSGEFLKSDDFRDPPTYRFDRMMQNVCIFMTTEI